MGRYQDYLHRNSHYGVKTGITWFLANNCSFVFLPFSLLTRRMDVMVLWRHCIQVLCHIPQTMWTRHFTHFIKQKLFKYLPENLVVNSEINPFKSLISLYFSVIFLSFIKAWYSSIICMMNTADTSEFINLPLIPQFMAIQNRKRHSFTAAKLNDLHN